jgi:hypothetical protein
MRCYRGVSVRVSVYALAAADKPSMHARLLSTQKAPTISMKKMLFPLIKKIHPDSCATETPAIQRTNLLCLQTLNEMIEKLKTVEREIQTGSSTIDISSPPKSVYALKFYIASDEGKAIAEHNIVMQVPRDFTVVQSISIGIGRKALKSLYVSIFAVLRTAGVAADLQIPNAEESNEQENNTPEEEGSHLTDMKVTEQTLQEYGYDRIMFERMTNMARYGSGDRFAPLFTMPERKNQKVPRYVKDAVEVYLRQGNVLVRHLTPAEELPAIERLREFLIDYSLLLNFHPGGWRKVYFILNKKKSKYTLKHKAGGDFIIIPANFKHKALLEFIRVNMPKIMRHMSDPVAASGLDEDELDDMEF